MLLIWVYSAAVVTPFAQDVDNSIARIDWLRFVPLFAAIAYWLSDYHQELRRIALILFGYFIDRTQTGLIMAAFGLMLAFSFWLTKKTDEVEAPIAIDIVPVDSEFAKKTHNPSPIDMSKDPIAAKPANIESNVHSNSFDAINKPSAKAKEILKAAKVLPTDLQNEAYIEFDLAALKTLKTGDNFDLAIPQTAETYSAEITNVTHASNGDKSIVGQVIGANGAMHTAILATMQVQSLFQILPICKRFWPSLIQRSSRWKICWKRTAMRASFSPG